MKNMEELELKGTGGRLRDALLLKVTDADFQGEVLERLGRLEAKIDMVVGGSQPGRLTLAENRITVLERSEVRHSVYDRLISAAIAMAVSAAVALHDHLGIR
jgi:hypothetical protein